MLFRNDYDASVPICRIRAGRILIPIPAAFRIVSLDDRLGE